MKTTLETILISTILALSIFLVDVNLDSELRVTYFKSISFDESNISGLIFLEPATFFILATLDFLGVLSPFSFQLSCFFIIILLLNLILKERSYFNFLILIIPPLSLLTFNIQPMMISGLIAYYVILNIDRRSFSFNSIVYFTSIMFHWSSSLFIPLIMKRYLGLRRSMLAVLILIPIVTFFFIDISTLLLISDLLSKIEVYQASESQRASVLHVSFAITASILIIYFNLVFRPSNYSLWNANQIYLLFIFIVILTVAFVGFKSASRICFLIDLFLYLDFVRLWVPKTVTRDGKLIYK